MGSWTIWFKRWCIRREQLRSRRPRQIGERLSSVWVADCLEARALLSNITLASADVVTSSIVFPGQRPVPAGSEPHLTEVFARISTDHFPLTIEEFVPAGNSFMEGCANGHDFAP